MGKGIEKIAAVHVAPLVRQLITDRFKLNFGIFNRYGFLVTFCRASVVRIFMIKCYTLATFSYAFSVLRVASNRHSMIVMRKFINQS